MRRNFTLAFCVVLFGLGVNLPILTAQSEKASQNVDQADLERYRQSVLSARGDAERGRRLFDDSARTRCKLCHPIEGKGIVLGPDLLGVGGRYDRTGLLESILQPSAKIHPDYATTSVVTSAGKVISGLLRPISDTEIEIATNETEKVRIAISDIEERKASPVSMMPIGLHQKLSPNEMSDLLAYLSDLRSATPGTLQDARDPREIPRATRPVRFVPIHDRDLAFRRPVWFGSLPGHPGTNVVIEIERGRVFLLEGEGSQARRDLFVDVRSEITSGEITGLMSIAFHPDFVRNRRYFLKLHGERAENGGLSVSIVERKATDDGLHDSGEPSKLRIKIPVFSEIHNGGDLVFGPDGYLYLGMGDTGPQEDTHGHGQDLGVLWGKLLRIDVDHTEGDLAYAIPPDNPFRDRPGARPEVWAYGLREPWRISFDSKTGDLWVGDVGQNRFEEVLMVRKGENYGWNVFEGFQNHSDRFSSKDSQYVAPLFAYNHAVGPSVTGGFVYRGSKMPSLVGDYVFGDFESRRVWALKQRDRKIVSILEIGRAPDRIVSFGTDSQGELYFVGFDQGMIYRLDFSECDLNVAPVAEELVKTSRQTGIDWRYTESRPASDWTQPNFDDGQWKSGPGGFGTRGTPGGTIRTEWRSGDIWLRREFELADFDPRGLNLLVHHDEDAEIYLNGILAARLPGFTRDYDDVPISPEALATLKKGKNTMAVHCHQMAGGQFIDVGITEIPKKPAQPVSARSGLGSK